MSRGSGFRARPLKRLLIFLLSIFLFLGELTLVAYSFLVFSPEILNLNDQIFSKSLFDILKILVREVQFLRSTGFFY